MSNRLHFIVIGAQKSASTSLQGLLAEQPGAYMPRGETPVFESQRYSADEAEAVLERIARAAAGRVAGIKRPDYLCDAGAPGNVARHAPSARLIAVLRNPVDRAVSAYYHYVRYGLIAPVPIEEGLGRMLDRASNGDLAAEKRGRQVLEYGRYGEALSRWHEHFSPEQILVFEQGTFIKNWQQVSTEITSHIGLVGPVTGKLPNRMEGAFNEKRLAIWRAMGPVLYSKDGDEVLRPRSRNFNALFSRIDNGLLSRIFVSRRPALSGSMIARLADYYADDVHALARHVKFEPKLWLDGIPK